MPPHLSKGSQDPPLKDLSLRIYSMRFCPYAQRAHLTLLAKKIPHDPVFINLSEKPEWYTQTVPTGKVPALKAEGTTLYESLIIADYLDEKYPGRKLSASTPLQRALDRIFVESWGKVGGAFYKCAMGQDGLSDTTFGELVDALNPLEKEIESRGTTFLGGNTPGMIDYMIWPWLERIPLLAIVGGEKYKFPADKLPRTADYMEKLKQDDAVASYYLSPETHAEHIVRRKAGLSTAFNL